MQMLHNRLQDTKTHSIIDDIQPLAPQQEGTAELVDWLIGLLRRQYLVILVVTMLAAGAGGIYLAVATPIYTAQTSVYIDLHKNLIDQQQGIFGNDPIEIESQIQIIKSKTVATSVVKRLQLLNNSQLTSGTSHFWNFLFGASAKSNSDPLEQLIEGLESNLTIEPAGGTGSRDQI